MNIQTKHLIPTTLLILSCVSHSAFAGSDDKDRGERRGPPQFSEFDLDNNGEITLEEFKDHKPPGSAEEIFSHIDEDGDGVIIESELTNHKPPKR